MKLNRRGVLKWLGIQLALPLVSGHLANAQTPAQRKRFIGAYVPNGAYMPMGVNGSWNWNEALAPLVTRGLQGNTMVLCAPAPGSRWGSGCRARGRVLSGKLSCVGLEERGAAGLVSVPHQAGPSARRSVLQGTQRCDADPRRAGAGTPLYQRNLLITFSAPNEKCNQEITLSKTLSGPPRVTFTSLRSPEIKNRE